MGSLKKILVFDDNEDILEIFRYILTNAGYEIQTLDNTHNVEFEVSLYMPNLIFMDNWLPGLNGVEATKILKNNPKLKHIPIIYFTANDKISELAKEAGADNYLTKPFDIKRLEYIVKQYTK